MIDHPFASQPAAATTSADGAVVSIASWDFGVDPNGHPPLRHAAAFVLTNSTSIQVWVPQHLCGSCLFVAFLCSAKHPHVAAPGFHFHCVQDELARMMADGRLKVIVESEFPFTQQGVTDMCAAPRCKPAAALHRCLPHASRSFAKIFSGKSLGKNVLNIA